MSKNKSEKKILIPILFVLVGILLFGYTSYRAYNSFFSKEEEKEVLSSIKLYGYTLDNNDSELYKSNFNELEICLNESPINYENYAKLASKLFIIDLFSIDNKIAAADVGGMEFIYNDFQENFKTNVVNTLYKNIENNIDGNRTQLLPKVSGVEITDIKETKYSYKEKDYDGYIVNANISYEVDYGYQNKIELTLIKENNILYIVEGK